MTDNLDDSRNPTDDMSEYLQMFLDETEEQLDDLVETMLALEGQSTSQGDLNEAFRLIHSIKGSAGMMGLDSIMVLTHHLESQFERFRAGTARLDDPTMSLVLRCVDFLRQCNNQLRDGNPLPPAVDLLEELASLESKRDIADKADRSDLLGEQGAVDADTPPAEGAIRMIVRFRPGLQLADLKAKLIVARLGSLGHICAISPDPEELTGTEPFNQFAIDIESHEDIQRLRAVADVAGVESIEFGSALPAVTSSLDAATPEGETRSDQIASGPRAAHETIGTKRDAELVQSSERVSGLSQTPPSTVLPSDVPGVEAALTSQSEGEYPEPSSAGKAGAKVSETMRVDIDRLDKLMNLAGELVVNRARFVQISGQVSPALRKASMLNRVREFRDSLRGTIETLEYAANLGDDWSTQIHQLRNGLELLDEQTEIWSNGRQCFNQMGEAIDQLSRVSHGLQRGVLGIRMVPVGPLFSRFKRVVRDLARDRGKKVSLLIRGEKTELDKRMIDELGDPLVHLVRNSLDHGLESSAVRARRGKSEIGTILLEANHSGNNVYIYVRDDGGGIDVEKIRTRLVERSVLSESDVQELTDEQALEYIWHPGFSTAAEVTDVSGRGVGMDVVKTRINHLNGAIQVDSAAERGTTFTIRLPLTLAIINSLLIRVRNVVFSIPVDDVRDIVSVKECDVVTVRGKQTCDVRGEFIPLVTIDDVFQWHDVDYGYEQLPQADATDADSRAVEVVVLHAGGKALGLRVDELLGAQEMVIKSLSDNFIHVRGLSGASILGDGKVCLMLDVSTVIETVTTPARGNETERVGT